MAERVEARDIKEDPSFKALMRSFPGETELVDGLCRRFSKVESGRTVVYLFEVLGELQAQGNVTEFESSAMGPEDGVDVLTSRILAGEILMIRYVDAVEGDLSHYHVIGFRADDFKEGIREWGKVSLRGALDQAGRDGELIWVKPKKEV